jgi:hypothetical protein
MIDVTQQACDNNNDRMVDCCVLMVSCCWIHESFTSLFYKTRFFYFEKPPLLGFSSPGKKKDWVMRLRFPGKKVWNLVVYTLP